MKKIIDISRTISKDSVVYPEDSKLGTQEVCIIGDDAPCNITELEHWTTHFLTHVDPPLHFIEGGKSLDDIPLERFLGEVTVVEIPDNCDAITRREIENCNIEMWDNVFFKTRNSEISTEAPFEPNYVYLSKDGADYLASKKINLVGIDYLGIDRYEDENYPAHNCLLSNEIIILEGLCLKNVAPGRYYFVALPLKIKNANGSIVRAVLIEG
jgi:arylformamidase